MNLKCCESLCKPVNENQSYFIGFGTKIDWIQVAFLCLPEKPVFFGKFQMKCFFSYSANISDLHFTH